MSDQYRRATAAQRESWNLAQYALQNNREILMNSFNKVVGLPSYAVATVQHEFINGQMGAEEMMDYARAIREIIFSIESTLGPATDPPA